jgi:hypothetical protein
MVVSQEMRRNTQKIKKQKNHASENSPNSPLNTEYEKIIKNFPILQTKTLREEETTLSYKFLFNFNWYCNHDP